MAEGTVLTVVYHLSKQDHSACSGNNIPKAVAAYESNNKNSSRHLHWQHTRAHLQVTLNGQRATNASGKPEVNLASPKQFKLSFI
jgi:hypothetical protein